jgi:hypothetical protein
MQGRSLKEDSWLGVPCFCLNTLGQSGPAMCNMRRFYVYKQGCSFVEDVPRQDAAFTRHRLLSTGCVIYFEVDI